MVGQTPWWFVLGEQVLSLRRMCGQPSVSGQVNMRMFQVFRQKQKREAALWSTDNLKVQNVFAFFSHQASRSLVLDHQQTTVWKHEFIFILLLPLNNFRLLINWPGMHLVKQLHCWYNDTKYLTCSFHVKKGNKIVWELKLLNTNVDIFILNVLLSLL